jgi:hypothetical protein
LVARLYFSCSPFYLSHLFTHLSSLIHLLLVNLGGSAVTPSHIQRGPSVAIPSVRRPKLSHQWLHPLFIVQVGPTLSEALQKPYSGDLRNLSKANTELLAQSQSNTDSESLTKKDKIEVVGDLSTETPMTKNPWHKHSSLVAIKETPQTLTSTYQELNQKNERNAPLLHWLNSFPHTLPNPTSIPLTDYLHWLLECHKSQQLPLSLQQAHWDELLELEYLREGVPRLTPSETSLEAEEDLEEDRRMVEDLLLMQDNPWTATPLIQPTQELEEGEIPQTLEEGEILLTVDSPIS